MEVIYTGYEKKIHYILTKRVIKRYSIKTNNIAQIHFKCLRPSETMPLWTVKVSIYEAGIFDTVYSDNFYTKDCISHDFYITWANLKKLKF
jgi:hypothetical protein